MLTTANCIATLSISTVLLTHNHFVLHTPTCSLHQDYSLWNKLGATLANFSHSRDALGAYQKALDLKPNYMRAWTNMGIAHANIGDYETSAKFYVAALDLNPGAGHVWSYLRTSLACAGRTDLLRMVDEEALDGLRQALPLQDAAHGGSS